MKKHFFSCFLNTGLLIFILLWISQIMELVLPGWVTFPLGHPFPYQETRPLTLLVPLPCSQAHYEGTLGWDPWAGFRNQCAVPTLGLRIWPFFLKKGFIPSRVGLPTDKSVCPPGTVRRSDVLELKRQSKRHPPPWQTYGIDSIFGIQASCEMERCQPARGRRPVCKDWSLISTFIPFI